MACDMERIRSALYVDFDNLFGGLMDLDRQAAYALAEEPGRWLDALATWKLPPGNRRHLLVRRAYLNPAGSVRDQEKGNDSGRLYFSTFRPNLTRSGIEVVDCPALTARQKNAADIRIVIDTLQSLEAGTRYDEFIVASSDTDFTPLFRLLRAHDRRTVIMSAGPTAEVYRNVADMRIDAEDLLALLNPEQPLAKKTDLTTAPSEGITMSEETEREARGRVEQMIHDFVDQSDGPALLSSLGLMLRSTSLESAINPSGWFGTGSLGALIRAMEGTSNLRTRGQHVWDFVKHAEPEYEDATLSSVAALPAFVEQYCRITDLPRLDSKSWKATFTTLQRYASDSDFNLTQCTAWTRDQLKEEGIQVGRQSVGYIVRGALFGGVSLDATPAPSADDIREALIKSTMDRAQAQGLAITDSNISELRGWLRGTSMSLGD